MRFLRLKYCVIVMAMAFFVLSSIPVLAVPPENFTATMVSQGMEMPMARMGTKSRVENAGMPGVITISLGDTKKTVMMNTTTKVYSEQLHQERDQMPNMYDPDVVFDKKKVGNETIDGHPCVKYDAVYYRKNKPDEKHKTTIWEAQDLKDFPIQMEITVPANPKYPGSGGKMLIKYKNVKLGAATASMFEVPAGYKKVNSPQEVMGFGGMGNMEEMMKKIPKGQRPPQQ
jgi:Domain of unknown function (DUF4412)